MLQHSFAHPWRLKVPNCLYHLAGGKETAPKPAKVIWEKIALGIRNANQRTSTGIKASDYKLGFSY